MLKMLSVVAGLGLLIGCQRGDPTLVEKLDKLQASLDRIQRKVDSIQPGAAAPARPQPPPRQGADPGLVYSVPLGDAAVHGPANAKVTIVEAADFA